MKKIALALATLSMSLFSLPTLALGDQHTTQHPAYEIDNKVVLGRVENVYIGNIDGVDDVPFTGKIDTGADTTSMHAENIKITSSNPKYQGLEGTELLKTIVDEYGGSKSDWWLDSFDNEDRSIQGLVSFTVRHPYSGEPIQMEQSLTRTSVIRSRTSEEPIYRPVVTLPLTIAGTTVETEVNLTDRSQFSAPILIGKTFLSDNAWVFAGYDYLQEQPKALVVGKKETVTVEGVALDIRFSLKNSYSAIGVNNIQIEQKDKLVTFDVVGKKGDTQAMSLPLVRMLSVNGDEKPLVYLPVSLNAQTKQYWLVYLRDPYKGKTQLRVGLDTISESFMVNTAESGVLEKGSQSFSEKVGDSTPFIVSPVETVMLDQFELPAEPSFYVKTPLLKVNDFEVSKKGNEHTVEFHLTDSQGKEQRIIKDVNKTLIVGESRRPVVSGEIMLAGKAEPLDYALDVLDKDETSPYFVIGKKMTKQGVYVNTRADHLLQSEPLFKAGHIETVLVEGLTFPAKLDTGADVSSINALNIKQFERDGKAMVSFTYTNDQGLEQDFEKPVVDVMRIRAKKGEEANVRPVIEMHVTLGDLEKKIRVNLQDRSRFHYSMILGKNFLKYGAVVSSDENYLVSDEMVSDEIASEDMASENEK